MKLKKWIALLTALMLLAGMLPITAHADDECKRSPTGRHEWQGWTTVKEPTCTSKGTRMRKCRYCQNEQTESIPAKGHSWSKWKTTKEASCTKEGEQTRKWRLMDGKQTVTT